MVMGFLVAQTVKKSACNAGDLGSTLDWEDPLEEGMVTHSSILAWRIPMYRGAWRAPVHGFEYSQTQLSNEAQHMELFSFKMGVILTTLKSCYKDEITTL